MKPVTSEDFLNFRLDFLMTEKNRELFYTSRKFFKEGHYRLVEPLLKELLKENKFNPEIYYMAGYLSLEKGQLKRAHGLF